MEKLISSIEPFKVDPKDFQKDGNSKFSGGQGTIICMIQLSTGKKVVQKSNNDSLKHEKAHMAFYQEIEVLALSKHPAIVEFIGWALPKKTKGYIYLKRAEKGSLKDAITLSRQNKPDPLWDSTHKLIIAYGVASAMKYLHSMNLLHRDLKCENILLDDDLQPYITDFGASKLADDIKTSKTVSSTSYMIMPPEFLKDYNQYNRKLFIDVYSYAMVLYSLFSEKDPFEEEKNFLQIIEKVKMGERPEFPPEANVPEQWKKLITICWDQEPERRPPFEWIVSQLETPEFVTGDIDTNLFNQYKEKVNPGGSTSSQNSDSSSQNSLFTIDGIKKEADNGNNEAQLSYALHLYNGLDVEKDIEKAKHYFGLSADSGNNEAQFYYSLILAREGEIEKSTEYYQKSVDAGFTEAIANYANQLISGEQVEAGLQYIYDGLQKCSITSLLTYANLCDSNDNYGSSSTFYQMAANLCHCRDTIGFYFPIDYKVFRCEDCGTEICEGCAKHCHKGHNVTEIDSRNAFVCDCGKNHFVDPKTKKNCCSIEFVGESVCQDSPVCYQHLYKCTSCCKEKDDFICKACALNCHKDHNVIDCGIQKGFCACGALKIGNGARCKRSYFIEFKPDQCSFGAKKGEVLQRWFQCMTCGLYGDEELGVCMSCAHNCHKDHVLLDLGVKKKKCHCTDTNNCKLNE